MEEAAEDAYTFITEGLGFNRIDVFSYSMGGFIAQDLVVKHPDLVRKLILAGTGPRDGRNIDKVVAVTFRDILRTTLTRLDPKEYLFFNSDNAGKKSGRAFISIAAFRTQWKAIQWYGRSAPSDLSVITQPTLIALGDNDRIVPSILSADLHRRIRNSELITYPNSGNGAIFQCWEEFSPVAAEFLAP
jgi:pimeloyl-ACP methyl ester carboxylesterase